ncbi:MAG TPA: serine hydrolase domain-containing protein [Candidatus Baltobacteraceae bacterium]|nr:serine hydrolase domain-containing protein [Candidatus Baltobacteraceae bacterium]
MKFAFAFILGCALVCSSARGADKPPSITSPTVQSAIRSAVEKDRAKYGGRTPIPGVLIGVWDERGASFVQAFGYADLAQKRPLTPADSFRIGSNTKTFVASVILRLAAERKLSLDDTVSHFHVGVNVPNAGKITVRELCDMRSGLFEAYETPQFAKLNMTVPKNFNPRTLVAWAALHKPLFAPGTRYNYSNTNYLLLGLIIESITKDSVGDQIRKRLLVPFGLSQTIYPQTQAMPPPWAHGYALDKNGNWEDVSNATPVAFMGSAGEMVSVMADVKRWVELFATGKTGGPVGFRPASECIPFLANTSFGLGMTCSAGWFGYTGGLPGYNTADYYSPSTGMTIVAWTTYHGENPPEGVASVIVRDIARILTPGHVPFVYTKQQLEQSGL